MQLSDTAVLQLTHFAEVGNRKTVRICTKESFGTIQYSLAFDDANDGDIIISLNEVVDIVVDKKLYHEFVKNVSIDWKNSGKFGSGFSVSSTHGGFLCEK